MMSTDDLCSTISSSLAEFEGGGSDEGDEEASELKYFPDVEVKTEADEGIPTAEDLLAMDEDDFLSSLASENGSEGAKPEPDITEDEEEKVTPRRSSRARKPSAKMVDVKVILKEEEESDYLEDGDPEEDREPKKKKTKRQSNGTGASKTPRNARGQVAKRASAASRKPRSSSVNSSASGSGTKKKSKRKKVSEMTPEEREIWQTKWREENRRKRALQRETMTPEERKEFLRQQAERKKELRLKNMTPEQKEKYLLRQERKNSQEAPEKKKRTKKKKGELTTSGEMTDADAEKKKPFRKRLTPEEQEERRRRQSEKRRQKREEAKKIPLTEEEKKMKRLEKFLQNQARMSMKTPEEKERIRLKQREQARERRAKMSAEDKERKRQFMKEYRNNMTPEKRARFLGQLMDSYRRRRERLQQDPEKWAETKAKWQEAARRHKAKCAALGIPYRPCRRKYPSAPYNAEYMRKYKLKKREEVAKLLESGMTMEEIQHKMEDPEKREQRLIRKRINKKKLAVRRELESVGTPAEEIEIRVMEVEHTYQPTGEFRPFKPRKGLWKPVEISSSASTKPPPKVEVTSPPVPKRQKKEQKSRGSAPPPSSFSSISARSSQTSTVTSEHGYYLPPLQPSPLYQPIAPHHPSSNLNPSQYPGGPADPLQPSSQTPPQPYSLQNILDGITYRESGGAIPAGPRIVNEMKYQHPQESSSSQPDYSSGYDNDNHSPPPASPGGYSPPHDFSGTPTFFPQSVPKQEASPSSTPVPSYGRGRPRKDEPPRPKKPGTCGFPPGPRGPKKNNKTNVILDSVCDECGNAYNHVYLRDHKVQFHNPHYKNQTCQLCGERFTVARKWYRHYLHTHVEKEVKPKPEMCEICGRSFGSKSNLEKHKYHKHGDGLKKENYVNCPHCNDGKLYKGTESLYMHLKTKHPEHVRKGHDCFRCGTKFSSELLLCQHVQENHPESYFPCEYCKACRFTKTGLNFHYLRCKEMSKEVRDEMLKREGGQTLENLKVPCEFCGKELAVAKLTRHYMLVHGVKEEDFVCGQCQKIFKTRQYLLAHLEERHMKTVEEMKEEIRRLNVKSREGLVIQHPRKVRAVKTPRGEVKKAAGGAKRGRRGRKPKKEVEVTSEMEEVEKGEKKGRKKRKIVVIAEEDEMEEGGSQKNLEVMEVEVKKRELRRRQTKKKVKEVSSSDEEEEEDSEWSESEDEED